jgi:hypothetical protein
LTSQPNRVKGTWHLLVLIRKRNSLSSVEGENGKANYQLKYCARSFFFVDSKYCAMVEAQQSDTLSQCLLKPVEMGHDGEGPYGLLSK